MSALKSGITMRIYDKASTAVQIVAFTVLCVTMSLAGAAFTYLYFSISGYSAAPVTYSKPLSVLVSSTTGCGKPSLYRKTGDNFFLEGKLNGTRMVYLLDTGASQTAIPVNLLNLEGGAELVSHEVLVVETSGGLVPARVLAKQAVSLAGVEFLVNALLLPTAGSEVILGMDVIRLFDLRMSNDQLTLVKPCLSAPPNQP